MVRPALFANAERPTLEFHQVFLQTLDLCAFHWRIMQMCTSPRLYIVWEIPEMAQAHRMNYRPDRPQ